MDELLRYINKYADACVAKSWMGSRPPEEWPEIRRALMRAAFELKVKLRRAIHGKKTTGYRCFGRLESPRTASKAEARARRDDSVKPRKVGLRASGKRRGKSSSVRKGKQH